MKKMNRLVALLLAAVMVLGMMPTMTAHAHEHEHSHTHAVELTSTDEYPTIALDTTTDVAINEAGAIAYFAFTPEVTDVYHYYASYDPANYLDTYGAIYDADFNLLTDNDDANWGNPVGITSPNFLMTMEMTAGTTYILAARLYRSDLTGTFYVTITNGHNYTSAVTKEPTCTEDGVLTYTCSYCGDSYEEAIPAAHEYDNETGKCIHCGEDYLITGKCGDDLTWSLDWFGKMTISGTGDMYDYSYSWQGNTPSPWYEQYNGDITSVVVEEGCTSVGSYAFYQCTGMTEFSLASTVTNIGDHAFQNTGITTLTVPETVTTIETGAFSSNYNLTEATLPSGLTAIPDNCFAYCGALTTINWPAAVTSIGKNALYSCNLSDLVIPEGVTYIDEYAVGGNSNMTMLTLPTTLTELAPYAFSSCYNTTDFIFKGNAPTIGTNAFSYVTTTVWYPAGNDTWTADIQQNYGGTVTWKALCAEHTWGEWTTVEATCTVGAYDTRSCTVCGWTEVTPYTSEPLGHDYVETVIEPNCATWEYGRTEVTCTRCDYYESKDWVPYEHTYEAVVTEATCTTDGYTTHTCTKCGTYYTDSYVAATGHSVAEWSEPTEATCTEASVKTGVCANCNETVTEEVSPALGHTWDEENYVENDDGSKTYTCTVCGETYRTEGTVLYLGDNEFSIAGNSGRTTKTYTAAEDGTLTITMNNMVYHNQRAWDNGWTDQYWQELGINWCFGEGFFNVYINDVNTGYTGNGDHEVILNAVEVKAGDVVTVEVNHTEGSYYYENDVKCNMNLALVSAHTHNYEAVVTEPTCTEGGYTTYTCECGDSYVADETEALGHTEEIVPGYAATCTKEGLTEGKICSVCGETLVAQEVIPAIDCPSSIYTDVPTGNYYHNAVDYVTANGIMNGMGGGLFQPNTKTNRAMMVTLLYRIAGSPSVEGLENPFEDVKSGYYYNAVIWAYNEGIVKGITDTTFAPNNEITRGQMVTMLYRYAGSPEANLEALEGYTDAGNLGFAKNAFAWAIENGIVNGMTTTTLGANGTATRAQIAVILYRYLTK